VEDTLDAGIDSTYELVLPLEMAVANDNRILHVRGRGIVMAGRVIEVNGNYIDRPTDVGIVVGSIASSVMLFTQSKLIRVSGNTVYRANARATGDRNPAAILAQAYLADGVNLASAPVFDQVVFSDNIVHHSNNGALLIHGATKAAIVNNTLSNIGLNPQTGYGFTGAPALMVHTATDAYLDGNIYSGASREAQGQTITGTVSWGHNTNIAPSTGTNPITAVGSAAIMGAVTASGIVDARPTSGAAVLAATSISGQNARVQLVEAGGAAWYMINNGATGEFVIDRNDAAGASPNLKLTATDKVMVTDEVTGTGVTPNGTIKLLMPDGTVRWLLTSATQN
jgi:hypothetical protein